MTRLLRDPSGTVLEIDVEAVEALAPRLSLLKGADLPSAASQGFAEVAYRRLPKPLPEVPIAEGLLVDQDGEHLELWAGGVTRRSAVGTPTPTGAPTAPPPPAPAPTSNPAGAPSTPVGARTMWTMNVPKGRRRRR